MKGINGGGLLAKKWQTVDGKGLLCIKKTHWLTIGFPVVLKLQMVPENDFGYVFGKITFMAYIIQIFEPSAAVARV